jgi:transcriptional regulator with XRE-family HTH domain
MALDTFGDRLKGYAKDKYKTVEALGMKLGVDKTTMSRYCTNKVKPSLDFLEKLRADGADINYLIDGTRKEESKPAGAITQLGRFTDEDWAAVREKMEEIAREKRGHEEKG